MLLRALVASIVVIALSGCGQFALPELQEIFVGDHAKGQVKRDGMGNPVLPNG